MVSMRPWMAVLSEGLRQRYWPLSMSRTAHGGCLEGGELRMAEDDGFDVRTETWSWL